MSGLLLRFTTDDAGLTTAFSFVLVASLFAIFAIPLFALVHELPKRGEPFQAREIAGSWRQLGITWQHAGERPGPPSLHRGPLLLLRWR